MTVARVIDTAARERDLYILLVTGVEPPTQVRARQHLQLLPGAVGTIEGPRQTLEAKFLDGRDDWIRAAQRYRDDAFFGEVDALEASVLNRALIKAQCLFAAGRGAHANVLLAPHFDKLQAEPMAAVCVTAARIALDGADVDRCAALAAAALDADDAGAIELGEVVKIAMSLESSDLGVRALAAIERRYPGFVPVDRSSFANADPLRASARVVIEALRRWALSVPRADKEDASPYVLHRVARDLLLGRLTRVFAYLSDHPEDGETRARLARVLDRDRVGRLGAQFPISAFVDTPQATYVPVAQAPLPDEAQQEPPDEEVRRFLDDYDRLLKEPRAISDPDGLPIELRGERCRVLRPKILQIVEGMAEALSEEEGDWKALLVWTSVACDVADYCGMDGEAPQILGIAISAVATLGDYQGARDLAENTLQRARHGTVGARRAAWCSFADAYVRSHNPLEGALGWICAMHAGGAPPALTPLRAVQELLLRVRILREFRLYDLALSELARAREIARDGGLDRLEPRFGHLNNTVLLSRLQRAAEHEANAQDAGLDELCDLAVASCQEAQAARCDLLQTALLAAEVIALLKRLHRDVPRHLSEALDATSAELDESRASVIRALAMEAPTTDALLHAARLVARVRDSLDLGTDLRHVHIVAARALELLTMAGDSTGVLLAVELTANHALPPPGHLAQESKVESTLPMLLRDPGALGGVVSSLRAHSIELHALATTPRGRLVRVSSVADGTHSPVLEEVAVFDHAALRTWRESHPFKYHENVDLGYVERSIAGIGTSASRPTGTAVYVLDHAIADLPVNLLRVAGDFAGAHTPTAVVPSLTWLRAVWDAPRVPSGRRLGWFLPDPGDDAESSPILVLRNELEPDLRRRGISVHSARTVASDIRRPDLVLVGGHGSVWPENGFFRAMADDVDRQYAFEDVARSLADAGVVVLLVCSGGRIDTDGLSASARGAPYELMRHGVRAVVGSPWPLEVLVARTWALAFLEAWDLRFTVAESVHLANETLRARHRGTSHFLAMHLYGNPLERATPVAKIDSP